MFKTYITIALRNLKQQKGLTLINISGLAIGLACFILFSFYALTEFNYDTFNQKANKIYRLVVWYEGFPNRPPGGEPYEGIPAGPAMKQDLPGVKAYARLQKGFENKLVSVGDNVLRTKLSFTDPDLFRMFTFKWLDGSAATALNEPNNIVLTKEKALQLFGSTDVAGKNIQIKAEQEFEVFRVGGVIDDIPANSSIAFDVIGNLEYLLNTPMGKESESNWQMSIGCQTFVELEESTKLTNDAKALASFRQKYLPAEATQLKDEGFWKGSGPLPVTFRLQPLLKMHTDKTISGGIDTANIWLLLGIAAGVLTIACINFTTLSIGRSAGRAKEVGLRKVMGSRRKQLVLQFLSESVLLAVISSVIALGLVNLLLPFFNELAGSKLVFSLDQYPMLLLIVAGATLLTGILAGLYPATVLSGFQPVEALKKKIRLGGSNVFTRSLVTTQFVLSIALLVSMIIILQQLNHMRSKNIGFDKENIVMLDADGIDASKIYPVIRQELLNKPGISAVSASSMGMGEGMGHMGIGFKFNGDMKGAILYPVDANFIETMGMRLIAGRNFNPELASDSINSMIVNEAFLQDFQVPLDKALGVQFREGREDVLEPKTIIGVVKNFHFSAVKEAIRPQIFIQPSVLDARKIYVKLEAGHPKQALSEINKVWNSVVTGVPFQYNFVDDAFDRFYKNEEKWMKVVGAAGVISMFLACLGLFGLAALAAVNRTKEMGIRKVLGATTLSLVNLLSKDFIKLVGLSLVIALPVAWYAMHQWLRDYEYRIELSPVVFGAVAVLSLLIAFITTGIQALKAAGKNPAVNLQRD